METKKNVYIKEVERDSSLMIKKTIAIAALARNCEDNLPKNIKRIEKLRSYFSGSDVFVYENNSTDSTKDILREWQEESVDIILRIEDIDESKYKSNAQIGRQYRGTGKGRIRKMCDCRNKLLQMIRERGQYDIIIFKDIDVEWFSVEGIVSAIENAPKGWGGLFANCYCTYCNGDTTYNHSPYYDTFAYLKKGYDPKDMKISELSKFRRHLLSYRIKNQIEQNAYFECQSAFGGIGIYDGHSIDGIMYELFTPSSWNEYDVCPCEHIFFNSKIGEPKYIARDLEVCYYEYHLSGLRWFFYKNAPRLYNFIGYLKGVICG